MIQKILDNDIQKRDLKFLSLFSALYVSTLILTMIVENRIISFGTLVMFSGTLVIPISYALSDMITEVYGYKQMRRIIWVSIACLYFCAAIITAILHLPTDKAIAGDAAYAITLRPFTKDVLTYSVAAVLSIFLNAYILSKLKILVRGRYFWLRSLGSMAIGEAIFIITWGFLAFGATLPFHMLVGMLLMSYFYKIIFNFVSIIPSSIIVSLLKKAENQDVYDIGTAFNPFSMKM